MKILFIVFISTLPYSLFATVVSLAEAIQKNTVKIIVSGNPTENNPNHDSHTGKCLKIQLHNTSGKICEMKIENACRFSNEEKAHQDLITTESMLVKISPLETKTITINALCCEKNNGSPSESDTFQFVKRESSSIEKLCNLLERQKNFGNTAQQALWCFTDNNPLENIYDTHTDIKLEDELLALVASEKGLVAIPPRKNAAVRILRHAIEAEGKYSQWVDKPTTIGIYITDSLNNPLITLMNDEKETRINGTLKYSYGYRGLLPEGKYFLQVKVDGVWKKEKEIVIGRN